MDLLYINENSLSKELCHEIIDKYENEGECRTKGVTAQGFNPFVKNTLDFTIFKNEKWEIIHKTLYQEIARNLQKYIDKNSFINDNNNNKIINGTLWYDTFMVQRYTKCEGKYIYHEDFHVNNDASYRVLTYLWYLNDVDEGGETEFFGNFKIKPKAGKLVIFPAFWTYPHTGLIPISNDKYILTGWIYKNYKS
jgi:hypothetical protein